jgi:hypothetical protein
MLKKLLLFILLSSPVVVWALYKPVRVLAPQWVAGISCPTKLICIEDISRIHEATELYQNAVQFVAENVASFQNKPLAVFCSSEACFRSFGFNRSSAQAIGASGIVISPRGWQPHYLRHEMIHHVQAEQLGIIHQLFAPDWFKEGMAYSLSEDPRVTLAEPMQQYRSEFDDWLQQVGKENMWPQAHQL